MKIFFHVFFSIMRAPEHKADFFFSKIEFSGRREMKNLHDAWEINMLLAPNTWFFFMTNAGIFKCWWLHSLFSALWKKVFLPLCKQNKLKKKTLAKICSLNCFFFSFYFPQKLFPRVNLFLKWIFLTFISSWHASFVVPFSSAFCRWPVDFDPVRISVKAMA